MLGVQKVIVCKKFDVLWKGQYDIHGFNKSVGLSIAFICNLQNFAVNTFWMFSKSNLKSLYIKSQGDFETSYKIDEASNIRGRA